MTNPLKQAVLARLGQLEAEPEAMHEDGLYEQLIKEVDDALVGHLLVRFRGNQTQAALHLGMHRATFRKKLGYKRLRGHGFYR